MKKILVLLILTFFTNSAFADTLEYVIQIKNHRFIPAILEVPAQQKFRLIVENHDDTAAEFESHDLGKEKIITAQRKATLIIFPLNAGEYYFFDDFRAKETIGRIIAK